MTAIDFSNWRRCGNGWESPDFGERPKVELPPSPFWLQQLKGIKLRERARLAEERAANSTSAEPAAHSLPAPRSDDVQPAADQLRADRTNARQMHHGGIAGQ